MTGRSLEPELVEAYNQSRLVADRTLLCRAPFSNIYFNVMGQGAACWLTFHEAPRYPESTVREIWFGSYFERLRALVRDNNLSERCGVCERNIRNRLFANPLAKAYDVEAPPARYPSIMEFELSNQCNLACEMCNGRLSSIVRKTRDQLPERSSPYDDRFIDQLEEFIPHLREARFNGGEPFLQEICWKAWERIVQINPGVEITIATNGTVWSSRVESLLSRGKFRINLSLDGMTAETYESIRVRSKFDRVMENIVRFGDYCRSRNTLFSIMVNPMRTNWKELPQFVDFCAERGYQLWFNTVYRPFHLALWTLPSSSLYKIHEELSHQQFKEARDSGHLNRLMNKYRNFTDGQVLVWAREQEAREKRGADYQSLQNEKIGAKDRLKKKLGELYPEPSRFSLAWKKLETLEERVSRNVDRDQLCELLLRTPIEWVKYDLESRSLEEMIENVYYRAEYY